MIEVKARKQAGGDGAKAIPEFLRVDPQQGGGAFPSHLEAEFKEKLTTAMKPTPDMMGKVLGDPNLLSGFDDPEVMRAVEEISKDPSAMARHQNNPKVAKFYRAMAGMMASRCDELAAQEGGEKGSKKVQESAERPQAQQRSQVVIEELD